MMLISQVMTLLAHLLHYQLHHSEITDTEIMTNNVIGTSPYMIP